MIAYVVAALVFGMLRPAEPELIGRPLGAWVREIREGPEAGRAWAGRIAARFGARGVPALAAVVASGDAAACRIAADAWPRSAFRPAPRCPSSAPRSPATAAARRSRWSER